MKGKHKMTPAEMKKMMDEKKKKKAKKRKQVVFYRLYRHVETIISQSIKNYAYFISSNKSI